MPRVNGKTFSYDKEGREAARKEAKKAGMRKRDKNMKNKGRK